jgi:DNA (cytosine-5)-methyltransferase 1
MLMGRPVNPLCVIQERRVLYGIKTLWASEIEPFPISVTKIRFPEMAHMGNICDLKGENLRPVDIVCGGSLS